MSTDRLFQPPSAGEESAQTPAPREGKPAEVTVAVSQAMLIVEPDEHFARLVAAFFSESGWVVSQTTSGRRGLALCQKAPPDAVITAIDLDDLDGLEFVGALRSLAKPPAMVICTQLPGVQGWEDSLSRLGVGAVVVRPARLDAIKNAVETALRSRVA